MWLIERIGTAGTVVRMETMQTGTFVARRRLSAQTLSTIRAVQMEKQKFAERKALANVVILLPSEAAHMHTMWNIHAAENASKQVSLDGLLQRFTF